MCKGIVKYFNDRKGWGIITSEDASDDVYVHYTKINMDGFKTLKQGQRVIFQLTHNNDELLANDVSLQR
ncbi:MAG: cold shock domain-containing protein [candidate division Zixibacteria bacterium]|nr:cold shock domain-containing protein [candidate division Zixibacteria bacterium]